MAKDPRFCPWCFVRTTKTACRKCGCDTRTAEDVAPDERHPFSGQILDDRYRVTKFIDSGGMGSVYRAFDSITQCMVAIKFLGRPGKPPADMTAYRRFRREASLLARVRSPHAVRFIDFEGLTTSTPYLVMELLRGRTLMDEMWRRGAIRGIEVLQLIRPVCDVLSELHALRVVHRDLKPTNIFLNEPDGWAREVKVLDFGLSKYVANSTPGLLRLGARAVFGTPEYMAPEQVRGGRVTHQSDLYALGVILYEMATGRLPFEGEAVVVMNRHVHEDPAPLVPGDGLSSGLCDLIHALLAKRPHQRPASAAEVQAILVRELAGG